MVSLQQIRAALFRLQNATICKNIQNRQEKITGNFCWRERISPILVTLFQGYLFNTSPINMRLTSLRLIVENISGIIANI